MIAIRPLLRNAMNNKVCYIITTDEYTYGTGTFVRGNVVIGMRNVVMVFANMGMGIGNWEMGIRL